jgi:dTDP-4-dehydrorhamnose reductase
MTSPRVLLIGKLGQVGWELQRTLAPLGSVMAVDFPEIDLRDAASIRRCLQVAAPDVIVNAAAYTAVDKAESEPELAAKINAEAPGILAEEAAKAGALCVHYSTDYVYDGTRQTAYEETDSPNPLSVYGRTKLDGDRAVQAAGGRHLIFRLSWVYGARGTNFMLRIIAAARQQDTLRVVNDQTGCPTWSRLIAETTALALKQVLAAADPGAFTGIYHLASSGTTTWHGFASAIVNRMPTGEKKCAAVLPIASAEYPSAVRRPAWSVLSCEKLARTFGLRLPGWEDSLSLAMEPS